MKRLVCIACVLVVGGPAPAGDLLGEPAAGSSPQAGPAAKGPAQAVTLAEAARLKQLREVAAAGDSKKLLEWARATKLKDATYDFRKEVLTLQAEAFRRTGQAMSAMNTYRRVMGYATKLPPHRRKKEVDPLILPIQVLQHARGGHYVSPAEKPQPGQPRPKGKPLADDANWEAAKADYAGYVLGRLDAKVKAAARITTPRLLQSKMTEALGVVDSVRPHYPEPANAKMAEVVGGFLDRFGQLIDNGPACRLASAMMDGSLMRSYGAINLTKWRAVCTGILTDLRNLYLDSYTWGKVLTQYAREHEVEGPLGGALSTLKSRNDSLKRLFVDADNYYYYKASRRGLTPKTIKNDPLSKIPTAPW